MVEPVDLVDLFRMVPERIWAASLVLAVGGIVAYVVRFLSRKLLRRLGVPEFIEGTAFERTLQDFGTSTVTVLAVLLSYFVFGLVVILALTVADVQYTKTFWNAVATFVPQLFIAAFVLIVGILIGDKAELLVSEQLRGYKVRQIAFVPKLAKYSVFYIAGLIALAQLQINTGALLILLGIYGFAVVVIGGIALQDALPSMVAGVYLLLNDPYGIGDEIRVGDHEGIVQEVDLFVTHVETEDGRELIVPNRKVFEDGITRIRN